MSPRSKKLLATFEHDGWRLESAEVRHKENPDTFWIPSREERDTLQIGALAQLLFQILIPDDPEGEFNVERMWVEVTGRVGDFYSGLLCNQPGSVAPGEVLDHGARVHFSPQHVIDIRLEPREPLATAPSNKSLERTRGG